MGGVIGGLVTAAAVVATIRHERHLSELTASIENAARLRNECTKLVTSLTSGGDLTPEITLAVHSSADEFVSRSMTRWPDLAMTLLEVSSHLVEALGVKTPVPEQTWRN